MRTAALCLAAVVVLLALCPSGDAQKTALRKCYISSQTLSGPPPTFNLTVRNQRDCFYTCDVKISAFYTYDNGTRALLAERPVLFSLLPFTPVPHRSPAFA